MKCNLSDICYFVNEKISLSELTKDTYISTENMLTNRGGITVASALPSITQTQAFKVGDVLVSNIRPYFKKIWHATFNGGCSNDVLVFRAKESIDSDFLYYVLADDAFFNYATGTSKGTKMPRGDKSAIMQYGVPNIALSLQIRIAHILKPIDNKISLNNAINHNLQQQAKAIFAKRFIGLESIPNGWKQGNLLDIANYLNGLAMQKYRPNKDELGLPVLKIKELRQGFCDGDSELCSPNIKPEYVIHDGDIVFSWSGSLLVDIWCGGICGLNQHLFKVTSQTYDKWFYYLWTAHHLERFIAIAADKATTMGHIKREELAKAEVLIPSNDNYEEISSLMTPIFNLIIENRIESRKLEKLRDELLPKLLSGEIDVSEVAL